MVTVSIKLNPALLMSMLLSLSPQGISGGKHDVERTCALLEGLEWRVLELPGDLWPHGKHSRKGALPRHVKGKALPRCSGLFLGARLGLADSAFGCVHPGNCRTCKTQQVELLVSLSLRFWNHQAFAVSAFSVVSWFIFYLYLYFFG